MRRVGAALAMTVAVGLAACGKHEFEPPDRAEQVVEADREFSMALFDSIAWPSDSIRALEGNVVFSTSCRNCHGPLGEGGTDYALERNLQVPSLVTAGWRYAEAPDSIRHRIFVGHVRGMPTWGVAGLTPREIDAVAHYIGAVLRPDVLGDGG